ncbi:MAG TPA: hypothetical protein VGB63_02910 [Pedobacter sp.]|jgi:disulfide oxidoreductase YuzD
MDVLKQITNALGGVLGSYFGSDMEVMSPEVIRIFSNEQDKRRYIDAVEKLQNTHNQKEIITLSNDETITLVS